MKTLYKQLVNNIAVKLNRAPIYVAHCILGRYKAKRSEIPVFVQAFKMQGIQVSERDFLHGTRVSNNPLFKLFRQMHTKPKHDKPKIHIFNNTSINPSAKVLTVDI
jgi:hypothetical protein